jgi:hypothetical protein
MGFRDIFTRSAEDGTAISPAWRREADFSNSFAAAPSALPVGFACITGKKIRGLINQASGSTY